MLYEFVPSLHQDHVNVLCIGSILVYILLKQGIILISFMCIYVCQCVCAHSYSYLWIPEEDVETPGAMVSCESPELDSGNQIQVVCGYCLDC